MVESGALEVAPVGPQDIPRILTLDRRDFGIYRPGRVGRFELLP